MGIKNLEVILDSSEYYDYDMAENKSDFLYLEVISISGNFLLTEDNFIFLTEDNYRIEYI